MNRKGVPTNPAGGCSHRDSTNARTPCRARSWFISFRAREVQARGCRFIAHRPVKRIRSSSSARSRSSGRRKPPANNLCNEHPPDEECETVQRRGRRESQLVGVPFKPGRSRTIHGPLCVSIRRRPGRTTDIAHRSCGSTQLFAAALKKFEHPRYPIESAVFAFDIRHSLGIKTGDHIADRLHAAAPVASTPASPFPQEAKRRRRACGYSALPHPVVNPCFLMPAPASLITNADGSASTPELSPSKQQNLFALC